MQTSGFYLGIFTKAKHYGALGLLNTIKAKNYPERDRTNEQQAR